MRSYLVIGVLAMPGFFTACSEMPQEKEVYFKAAPVNVRVLNKITVHWQVHDNVDAFCNAASKNNGELLARKRGQEIKGCAIWRVRDSSCIIATSSMTTHAILGHELRHCFEGHFHR